MRNWIVRSQDISWQEKINKELGISKTTAQILRNRGFFDVECVKDFLDLERIDFSSPFLLPEIDKAVNRIRQAIDEKEKIVVYGDYDADGVTATALLVRILISMGADVDWYLPDRFDEGYGVGLESIEALADRFFDLIITVDCGTSDYESIAYAAELGIDCIVTDHHQPPAKLPECVAIVNPHLLGSTYPFKGLCGAGVALKLGEALIEELPEEAYALASIGTIADIVPLQNENRKIAQLGMTYLQKGCLHGINAICRLGRFPESSLDGEKIAYYIAPRLNASGRMESAGIALRLMLTDDYKEADELARELEELNRKRKEAEKSVVEQAENMWLEAKGEEKVIAFAGNGWHKGVLGIAASRLAEKYDLPVILLAVDGDCATGSARSVEGFHMFRALSKNPDLFLRFGGHAMAAGMTLPISNLEKLRTLMNEHYQDNMKETTVTGQRIDCEILLQDIDEKMMRELEQLKPFGDGNSSPCFLIRDAQVIAAKRIGQGGNHLRFTVSANGKTFNAIGFGLGEEFEFIADKKINMLFYPSYNDYNGLKSIQLTVVDIELIDTDATGLNRLIRVEKIAGSMISIGSDLLCNSNVEEDMFFFHDLKGRNAGILKQPALNSISPMLLQTRVAWSKDDSIFIATSTASKLLYDAKYPCRPVVYDYTTEKDLIEKIIVSNSDRMNIVLCSDKIDCQKKANLISNNLKVTAKQQILLDNTSTQEARLFFFLSIAYGNLRFLLTTNDFYQENLKEEIFIVSGLNIFHPPDMQLDTSIAN